MAPRALLLCVVVLAGACVDRSLPPFIQPADTPPPSAPPIANQGAEPITVGQEVKGVFKGSQLTYELTPAHNGTLVATLRWDPFFNGSLLVLQMDRTEFKPVSPNWSPVSGELAVVAGRKYMLAVNPGGTDWFYDDSFSLTTSIQ